MDKKLLHKFISNQCTSNEIDDFFAQLEKRSTEKLKEKFIFRSHWDDIKLAENPDKESAQRRLDKIHHKINLIESELKENSKVRFLPKRKAKFGNIITRAAVILLIPVLTLLIYTRYFQPDLYTLLNTSPNYEIVSPPSSRIQFKLPDGTQVWLNQGSKMVYPQQFKENTRTVQLVGEGYFDVAHDEKKPFIVEIGKMAVKAVGTSFNVKAYAGDINYETTLESGKVVLLKDTNGRQSEVCKMNPGEQFIFNEKTNKYSLKTVNTAKYICWKEGKLIFADDHLDEVAERLSRWYNVKITLTDSGLKSLTYTATFVDEKLDQVLEMMQYIMPISYSVSNRKKLPDETYSEKEILIYKKGGKTNQSKNR